MGGGSDAGRDWGQEEKGMTEDEMAGWHHWLYGRESEWTPGVGDGQGGMACCDSWGRKESDTTEQLNWTEGGFTMLWYFFCATKWVNCMYTYIPSLLDPLPISPLYVTTEPWAEFPVWYIRFSLAICFTHDLHICQSQSPSSCHPRPSPLCPPVHSPCLCLY